jgi:acetyltransferase-like isoleucine patch superfamily enzyme
MKHIAQLMLLIKSLRRFLSTKIFKTLFKRCGHNVKFDPSNSLFSYSTIEIGNNVFIGGMAYWSSNKTKIIIGNYVMFGPNTKLIGGDHASKRIDIPMFNQEKNDDDIKNLESNIIIEDDVWVGAGSIILKGVRIGKGSIIGAGSIVTKTIDPYSVVVGNPAKKIRSRL